MSVGLPEKLFMKDAGVELKRLLGRDVAWNRGVGMQHHSDGGCGWEEELGHRCGGIRNTSALAPSYQGYNL